MLMYGENPFPKGSRFLLVIRAIATGVNVAGRTYAVRSVRSYALSVDFKVSSHSRRHDDCLHKTSLCISPLLHLPQGSLWPL